MNKNCTYCDQIFSPAKMKIHLTEVHDALKCEDCKQHHEIGNCKKEYICQLCFNCFNGKDSYKKHKETDHEIDHKCNICGKSFSDASLLNNIIFKLHEVNKDYTCDNCKDLKSKKTISQSHKHPTKTVHEEKKTFSCESCDKSFMKSGNLKNHIKKTHEDIVPKKDHESTNSLKNIYKCDHCDKIFATSQKLKNHTKSVHKERKSFPCELCDDKTFINSSDLKSHIYMNHECHMCGKKFVNKGKLDAHIYSIHIEQQEDKVPVKINIFKSKMKIDQEKNDYKCNTCGKSFVNEDMLKTHISSNHNSENKEKYIVDKVHKCIFCGKKLLKEELFQHIHKTHENSIFNRLQRLLKCDCSCDCRRKTAMCTHQKCKCTCEVTRIENLKNFYNLNLKSVLPDFKNVEILKHFHAKHTLIDKYAAANYSALFANLYPIYVPSDGSCFYWTLSEFLNANYSKEELAFAIRLLVFFKLVEDWENIEDEMKNRHTKIVGKNEAIDKASENIFEILSNCCSRTGHSGVAEIIAASLLLNVNICVIIPDKYLKKDGFENDMKKMAGFYNGQTELESGKRNLKLLYYCADEANTIPNHYIPLKSSENAMFDQGSLENDENDENLVDNSDISNDDKSDMLSKSDVDEGIKKKKNSKSKEKTENTLGSKFDDKNQKTLKSKNSKKPKGRPVTDHDLQCNVCHKTFTQFGTLNRHIKNVHEGLKTHKCDQCGKSFAQRPKMIQHIKTVHTKNKEDHELKCIFHLICKFTTNRRDAMNNHISVVHDKEKKYKCPICGTSFGHSGALKTHARLIHKKSKK